MKRYIVILFLLLILSTVHSAEIVQGDSFGFDRVPTVQDSNTATFRLISNQEQIKSYLVNFPTRQEFSAFIQEMRETRDAQNMDVIALVIIATLSGIILQTFFFLLLRAIGKW